MYAHTQTFHRRIMDRSMVPEGPPQPQPSLSLRTGFATPILAHMLDSLVRVSRRVEKTISSDHCYQTAVSQTLGTRKQPRRVSRQLNHLTHEAPQAERLQAQHWFHRFPFSNFRYSLTLFSKFFASFPHGTCSLSVSHQYLALDGIYHPL